MQTLIILHGWGHSRALWSDFVSRMQTDCLVEAWDLPGFGDEAMPPSAWGVPEYADWVRRRIEERGLQNVILLGHSFGGRIASFLAAQRPSWLRGLVLYAAPCLYRPSWSAKLRLVLAKVMRYFPVLHNLRRRLRSRDAQAADRTGHGDIFRKVVSFDQAALLPNIAVPTMLVWGEHDDEVLLKVAQEMNGLIPDAGLEIIPSAGHTAHIEHPILFYGIIKRFVESLA